MILAGCCAENILSLQVGCLGSVAPGEQPGKKR